MSTYDRSKDRSVGFCCHNAPGHVPKRRPTIRLTASGLEIPVCNVPLCIVKTKHCRTGPNKQRRTYVGCNHILIALHIAIHGSMRSHMKCNELGNCTVIMCHAFIPTESWLCYRCVSGHWGLGIAFCRQWDISKYTSKVFEIYRVTMDHELYIKRSAPQQHLQYQYDKL